MPLVSSILTRRILRFSASRTNNVSFGSSSTMFIGKTSRLYVSDGIDFFTEFEIAAKLSLELSSTRISPLSNSQAIQLKCSKPCEPFSTVLTINLFSDSTHSTVADDGLKRPLDNPITAYELECAFRRLRNGRTTESDSIPAELLKYGSELLAQPLANIIHHGLTTGDNIYLGDGILLGIPKPNMPAGQCASIRPIVLLKRIRKAISLVCFAASPQSGSSPFAALLIHRWIEARAQRYKERIYVLGIDLLRGFYTVNHNNFVSVLKTILDDEEFRLI
ncbi:hypothetical protein DD237_007719 [Peronospora effusa]|uniref:Reverse transcriptase domain-containing protein n=1 Tax=Peronospora effusa TaxID=542832 RepID=A0A3R7W222_9STRA|nr:hypothetical protein DD237_007719 [Peronospora effusa]